MLTTAHKAQTDAALRAYAIRVYVYARATEYVFADGSYLIVHGSGRTQVNSYTP